MLAAGTAAVVITTPVGTLMEGCSAREGGSQGVHDDLHARAVLEAIIAAYSSAGRGERISLPYDGAKDVRRPIEAWTAKFRRK